jgi:hypothetical protein
MAQVCTLVHASDIVDAQEVNLIEEWVVHVPSPDGAWYLESGAGSHVTGCRDMFSTLDETVHGTVRFGDGSIIRIQGRGTVVFKCLTGDHRVLGDIYFIPSLHSNIVSLGQLDENGCKIMITDGVMCILTDHARSSRASHVQATGSTPCGRRGVVVARTLQAPAHSRPAYPSSQGAGARHALRRARGAILRRLRHRQAAPHAITEGNGIPRGEAIGAGSHGPLRPDHTTNSRR